MKNLLQIKQLFFAFGVSIMTLLSGVVAAQTYELNGLIGVQGGDVFNYQLKLEDSAQNYLKGFAYSFHQPGKHVVANVIAKVDRANKKIWIKEWNILENNGFQSKAIVCLIETDLTWNESESSLTGPLISKTLINFDHCSKGSINFSRKNEIEKLWTIPVATQDATAKEPVKEGDIVNSIPAKPKTKIAVKTSTPVKKAPITAPAIKTITQGTDAQFKWTSDSLVFEIFDNTVEDGDKVEISYNGEVIEPALVLKNKPHTVRLPLGGNALNILRIKALNEGNDPPNTAKIHLKDGDKEYEVLVHNKMGNAVQIKIVK